MDFSKLLAYDRAMPDLFRILCSELGDGQKGMEGQLQAARMASIGELASGVAHQINNPLTTIIADAQLVLQMLPAGHPARESAEAIEQAGWRAQQVVQLLLEFSQPASRQTGDVSINGAIQRALTLVGADIQSSGVSLQVEFDENLPPVRGNTRQVEDLFVNLLLFARDATADGSHHMIRVRTRSEESSVAIEFHDDGTLIPPDQITAVSDRERGTIFQVRFPAEVQY